MKKLRVFYIFCSVLFCCPLNASNPSTVVSSRVVSRQDSRMSFEELPTVAQNILLFCFEQSDIVSIHKDKKKKEFVVNLKGGKKVVFNEMGEWILLDCKNEFAPFQLVPSKIRNHIASVYGPYVHPVYVEKMKHKFKIRLNNYIELIIK